MSDGRFLVSGGCTLIFSLATSALLSNMQSLGPESDGSPPKGVEFMNACI